VGCSLFLLFLFPPGRHVGDYVLPATMAGFSPLLSPFFDNFPLLRPQANPISIFLFVLFPLNYVLPEYFALLRFFYVHLFFLLHPELLPFLFRLTRTATIVVVPFLSHPLD